MKADDEIQAAVLALKNQDLTTKEIYREVCSLLFFRHGITPTVTHLYRLVQKGSMGVPTAVLAQFWADLRKRSTIDVAHPDLPKELADVAAVAIAGVWKTATALSDAQLEGFRASAREDVGAAQARAAELETALASMTTARHDAEALREKSEQLREALSVEHEAERRAHAASIARCQELHRQVASLQSQIDSSQVAFSRDLARAQQTAQEAVTRAEAVERRALLELDQERQNRQKTEKSLEKLREQATADQSNARENALTQAREIGGLKSSLESAEATKAVLAQAAQDAKVRIEALEKELSEATQRSTRLDAEAVTVRSLLAQFSLEGSNWSTTEQRGERPKR
jgi:chromosome segregation ATPase